METIFERLELENNPARNAQSERHKQIIEKYAVLGYSYAGYFPVKIGPSGKILLVDLVFQKKS